MADQSFTGMLKKRFDSAGETAQTARVRRTRIDARTVGYPHPAMPSKVVWMGMTPTGEKGDLWRVVEVEEEFNDRLTHLNEKERLVDINRGDETAPALSFEQAVEQLAVWEYSTMQKGHKPVAGQSAEDLGRLYYKDLVMRRDFVVSTIGETTTTPGGFIPEKGRKFLKSDLEAMYAYRKGLEGKDVLGELLSAHDPMYITDTSIEEDITSFGEINLFDKMQFFAKALSEYAKIKVRYIEEFYGNPSGINNEGLYDRLNAHSYFNDAFFDRYNELRKEFALYIFRFFEVDESDWGNVLDFDSRELRKELLKNPDAKALHDMLGKEITGPLDHDEVEALLTVSARGLLYFREQLKDSAQKDALERANIYRQADISDLLNFLDLLEIKYQYTELAKVATTLRGTQDHKAIKEQTAEFRQRVEDLKANLKDAGDFSAAQEAQIDSFIKANAPVYLLERVANLPGRIGKAYEFVAGRILPHNHQLSLDLDYTQGPRIAAPTIRAREEERQQQPKPGP